MMDEKGTVKLITRPVHTYTLTTSTRAGPVRLNDSSIQRTYRACPMLR